MQRTGSLTDDTPLGFLLLDLLEWVAARPRNYAETMEAWRTSCPRLPVWEDAVDGGLVEVVPSPAGRGFVVRVTSRGRDALARRRTG